MSVHAADDIGSDHEGVAWLHVLKHEHAEVEVVDEWVPGIPLWVLLCDHLMQSTRLKIV